VTATAKNTTATTIPTLRYNDAAAAVEWPCQAFGFEKYLVMPGENGQVIHAELAFANGMIMVDLAESGGDFDRLQQPPSQPGQAVTQSPYLIVEDVDNHDDQAIKSGAEIVIDIQDRDYGDRDYSCRHPEAFLWNFGT